MWRDRATFFNACSTSVVVPGMSAANNHASLSRRQWMTAVSVPVAAAMVPAILAGCAASAPSPSDEAPRPTDDDHLAGARVFNIRDFGAKGDGITLDTAAVQAAIDACTKDRGGIVLIPAGTFVIGTVELKENVTLHIVAQGKLLGSGDGKQYFAAQAIPLSGDSTLNDGNVGLIFAVN